MIEDGISAQVSDARQGEVPTAGPRLPSSLPKTTEWLERTGVLAEGTGLLHGPGLVPQVPFPVSGELLFSTAPYTHLSSCLWRHALIHAFPSVNPVRSFILW